MGTNLGKIILILYENIIFPIEEYFPDQCMDEYEEKLEIFLIMLQKPDNLNEMFYKCSQLEEISINEKDNSIVQEDKQKDLINNISENIEINNVDNEKANFNEWINEKEENDFYEYHENSTSLILNLSTINPGKSSPQNYFEKSNTNKEETKSSYFKDI